MTMRAALSIALVCAAAATARAGSNELEAGSELRALRSPSAGALTDNSLGGGHLAYARSLGELAPGLELWIGGGLDFGSAEGTMFQTMTTSIDTFELLATARVRYHIYDHVLATARVSAGSSRTSLDISDDSGTDMSDARWGAIGRGALGVELASREHARWSAVFRVEAGYARATAPALTLQPSTPDDGTLRLPMSDSSIGHLDLSGPFIAFSLASQF
ncbi:MAG TPA: hypothetical protein VGF94_17705 [Kofleriaceae bacterium]|jgi:hypothetical protein